MAQFDLNCCGYKVNLNVGGVITTTSRLRDYMEQFGIIRDAWFSDSRISEAVVIYNSAHGAEKAVRMVNARKHRTKHTRMLARHASPDPKSRPKNERYQRKGLIPYDLIKSRLRPKGTREYRNVQRHELTRWKKRSESRSPSQDSLRPSSIGSRRRNYRHRSTSGSRNGNSSNEYSNPKVTSPDSKSQRPCSIVNSSSQRTRSTTSLSDNVARSTRVKSRADATKKPVLCHVCSHMTIDRKSNVDIVKPIGETTVDTKHDGVKL